MSAFLFSRSSRRVQPNELKPGNRYRRQLGSCLAATATVLGLRSDLAGIPHVYFSITVEGSAARLSEGDTRVLALQSFLETYREPLAQESPSEPNSIGNTTVVRLLPRQAAVT
jgi:hypothetical protein